MILLADESVDWPIMERLRLEGHDTTYIAELSPGMLDDEVLHEANTRGALLLTEDRDFGELVYRLGRVHAGIVLIRLAGLASMAKADVVARVVQDHAAELQNAFTVISPGTVRIRKAAGP